MNKEVRKQKDCACCGGLIEQPLEQWHNQDSGTALCRPCADWIEDRRGADYLRDVYGIRGRHIAS